MSTNNNNNNNNNRNTPININDIRKGRTTLPPPTPTHRVQNKKKKLEPRISSYSLELSMNLVRAFGSVNLGVMSAKVDKSYVLNERNEKTFSKDINDSFEIIKDSFFQEAFNSCNMPTTVYQKAPAYTIDFIPSLSMDSEAKGLPLCGGNGGIGYSESTHPFTYKSWKDAEALKDAINGSKEFIYFSHKYNIKNAFVFLTAVRHEDRKGLRDIEVKTKENFYKECVEIIGYFEGIIINSSK